jgi:hypothetical protein
MGVLALHPIMKTCREAGCFFDVLVVVFPFRESYFGVTVTLRREPESPELLDQASQSKLNLIYSALSSSS